VADGEVVMKPDQRGLALVVCDGSRCLLSACC